MLKMEKSAQIGFWLIERHRDKAVATHLGRAGKRGARLMRLEVAQDADEAWKELLRQAHMRPWTNATEMGHALDRFQYDYEEVPAEQFEPVERLAADGEDLSAEFAGWMPDPDWERRRQDSRGHAWRKALAQGGFDEHRWTTYACRKCGMIMGDAQSLSEGTCDEHLVKGVQEE